MIVSRDDADRNVLQEWTELGCNMDRIRQQIRGEEQEVFRSIRKDVRGHCYLSFSPESKVFVIYTFLE